MRLDQILVKKGLAASRTQSHTLITSGRVEVQISGQWKTVTKPSSQYDLDDTFRVSLGEEQRFVSRAGIKLEAALSVLNLDLSGKTALDVGQSTGGFTDCLLQSGVKKVIGVDVGHDQLSPKLRSDPRVQCIEGVNARNLDASVFQESLDTQRFDLVVMDVSFISQTLILPRLPALLASGGVLVSLVKPQFEVGPSGIGKGGIVRDSSLYEEVKIKVMTCAQANGFNPINYFESPIKGGDGNREFFLCAKI